MKKRTVEQVKKHQAERRARIEGKFTGELRDRLVAARLRREDAAVGIFGASLRVHRKLRRRLGRGNR